MKFEIKIIKSKQINELRISNGFIVAGDIHLFNSYPYNIPTESVISSRLEDIYKALNEMGQLGKKLNLPIILNGDIIDSGILDYPVEFILTKFLTKLNNSSILINIGNHDLDGNVSVLKPLIKFSKNNSHFVFTKPKIFNINKVNYCFMPFMSSTHTIVELKRMCKKLNDNEMNILFIHNTFSKSLFPSETKSKSGLNQDMKSLSYFDLIVASHIHKYQEICSGRGFYTSSIIPLDFGEKDKEHGYHVVDVTRHKRYFVIPDAPKFKYIKLSELLSDDKNKVYKKIKGNIVCIKLDLVGEKIDKNKIGKKLIKKGAIHISFKTMYFDGKKKKTIAPLETKNIESIISSYSKPLSKKFNIKKKTIEKHGLRILSAARKELSKEKQRR